MPMGGGIALPGCPLPSLPDMKAAVVASIRDWAWGRKGSSEFLQYFTKTHLVFHPLLVIKLDILLVLPSSTVSLPHTGNDDQ